MTVKPVTIRSSPPLLAIAHGSRDPRAATTVHALLDSVRAQRPWLPVETSFLDHSAPSVEQAVRSLTSLTSGSGERQPIVVVPLLLTAAYHSKTDIPRVLAKAGRNHPRACFHNGDTLGPNKALTAALERRLSEVGVAAGDPETAVVLAAAGSSDPRANATVAEIARAWRSRGWWDVLPAYASAATPTPGDAVASLRAAGAPRIAVASYFLAPGLFADGVERSTVNAGADAVAPVLGAAPEVARVVADRYDEAAHRPDEADVAV